MPEKKAAACDRRIALRLPEAEARALERAALEHRQSVSAFVRAAVAAAIAIKAPSKT